MRCVYCILFFSFFYTHAQNAENNRARDWLQLSRLDTLAAADSSFLSAAEKKTLASLQTDRSPAAICSRAAITPDCGMVLAQPTGLKLTGLRLNRNLVSLVWQTAAEYNSKGFVLERRSFTDTLQFDSIAYAVGKGISTVKSTYGYADQNKLSAYYRVKELNTDSSYDYSNTVFIAGIPDQLTITIVPNPGRAGSTGFYISATSSPTFTFVISSSLGTVLVKEEKSGLSGGGYVSLAGYHLSSGFYILSVYTGQESASRRFVLY